MIRDRLKFQGKFIATCRDRSGNVKWVEKTSNLVTNEGLDAALDIMFHASTQITTWYVVLSESNTTPLTTHTYAVPGYTEVNAKIDEATRPEYQEAAASGQSMTNSANKATFTFNDSLTVYGAALVGGGSAPTTKGDTAGGGTLWCSALFTTAKGVDATDTIELTYTLTSADDGV
ncbi:MAG: hypothetical protein ACYTE8_00500 [Planctomycetota bacterium]|jgi:hypothetical protein